MEPKQKEGASSDIKKVITLSSIQEAKVHFEIVKQRLLNISNWYKISKGSSADFTLTDSDGKEVFRNAVKGDHFMIKIPAPGPVTGDGFDWVKIQSITNETAHDSEFLSIMVKPSKNPTSDKDVPAHFFSAKASSTFIVSRKGKTISAEIHGRNENPNIKNVSIADTIRNTIVALGAMLGLSDIQWKALAKGLISKEED